jgi:hyperosmotically inducible periplasmic protein
LWEETDPAKDGLRKEVTMRLRKHIVSGLFAVGLLGIGGTLIAIPKAVAAATTPADTATIDKQVHHELMMLPWYGIFDNLQYQIKGTEVTLSGQVTSEHAVTKEDAVNAVRRIPGVTNVVDNIEILPLSMFDNRIRQEEYRTIFSKSDLGRYTLGAKPPVHIIVKNGHVFLEGEVINQMDKTMAGIYANSVPGVFSVTNDLRIG